MSNIEFEQNILNDVSELKEFFEYIMTYKNCFMDLNKRLEQDFVNIYYPMMLKDNRLLLNDRYLECFSIITKALGYYEKAYEFPELMKLRDIRKYRLLDFHSYLNKQYDCCNYTQYLLAYAYYYSMNDEEFSTIINYFIDNYEEICEWGHMNGLTSVMIPYTYTQNEYYSIKKENYEIVTNYLIDRVRSREIK